MSDAPAEFDENHPSQAEGEDPSAPEGQVVLEQQGKPSSAEGEDPDAQDVHEVLDPVEPE